MTWTPEREKTLRDLWASGLSASRCSVMLGVTRNAILGKVRKLNLPAREPSGAPKSRKVTDAGTRPAIEKKAKQPAAPKPRKEPPAPKVSISAVGGTKRTAVRGVKPGNNFGHWTAVPAVPKPVRVDLLAAYPPTTNAVALFETGMSRCKWPLWRGDIPLSHIPEAERLCCGTAVSPGSPWCPHHRWIANSSKDKGPMPPQPEAVRSQETVA